MPGWGSNPWGNFPWGDVEEPPPPPPPPPPAGTQLPPVTVTLEDAGGGVWTPQKAGDLQWNIDEDLGDATCAFDITTAEYKANPTKFAFPTKLRLWELSRCIWAGLVNEAGVGSGKVTINGRGYGTLLSARVDAIPLQVMDLSVWENVGQLPWLDPSQVNGNLTFAATPDGYLRWVDHAEAGTSGIAGFVASFPDIPIGKIKFYSGNPAPTGTSPHYWQIWQASSYAPERANWYRQSPYIGEVRPGQNVEYSQTYPVTTIANSTHPAWNNVPASRNKPYDSIVFVLAGPANVNPGGVANAKDVRLWSTVTSGDTWTPTQMTGYVAGQVGWIASPVASGVNLLPYWSDEGQPWTTILDYIARAVGGSWRVHGLSGSGPTAKPNLQVPIWPNLRTDPGVWEISRTDHAEIDIFPYGIRYNAVSLSWQDVAGFERFVKLRISSPPFSALGTDQTFSYQLPGAFTIDSTYPTQFAQMLLDTFKRPQYSGTIRCSSILKLGVRTSPRDVLPGDAVLVTDDVLNPVGGLYHVRAVNHDEGGTTISVGSIAPWIEQQMFKLEQHRIRDPRFYL